MTDEDTKKVVLTRRRWDAYMFPLFVAAICIGAFLVWQTGRLRYAAAPLGVLPLWMLLRFQTPRDGMPVSTIRSTSGAVVFLWFTAATIALFGLILAIDVYVIGHPFHAPLKLYHAALLAPPFIVMFVGAFWADRLRKAARDRDA